MCLNVVSPRAAALRILAARYASSADAAHGHTYSLAEFQQEAVARATEIIRVRGGVIVADSVGLGKTFIAAALLELQLQAGGYGTVVVPAVLRRVWQRALKPLFENYPARIALFTHGQLSRGIGAPGCRGGGEFSLVVVDEAHAFRNPLTRRYRALRRLCRAGRVVLLSATPVNNSLSDLYFQLRLYAADNAFRDIGIGSLAALLKAADHDLDALRRLRAAAAIRRTRTELRARFIDIQLPGGERLRFPREARLTTVTYPPSVSMDVFEPLLGAVQFCVYRDAVTPILLRLSLLKRLQSSCYALMISLQRLIALYERYLSSLREGRLLTPRAMRADLSEQLFFTELMLEEIPQNTSRVELEQSAAADLATLRALHDRVASAADRKLQKLLELLRARGPDARTVVFTEFRDTAEYLWRKLQQRFQVGLVTGTEAYLGAGRSSRLQVIRSFAPRANGAPTPPPHEAVHVLIATDVLAEGLNLQDADAVVSYDLPWNPVRLIQRAGRVDRIGSAHDVVQVYNFMPDREFELYLGLVRRLRAKLAEMRTAVGVESAVLEQDELNPDFLTDLAAGRASLQEEVQDGFADELVHLGEAAPVGSVAALSEPGRTVLVSWMRDGIVRELLVDADGVREDAASADSILRRALAEPQLQPFGGRRQIAASRAFLRRQSVALPAAGRETGLIAREISRAVQRLGLLLTDEVIAAADITIARLPGYLGNSRCDITLLRNAGTPEMLIAALRQIASACTSISRPKTGRWQLVAAVALD